MIKAEPIIVIETAGAWRVAHEIQWNNIRGYRGLTLEGWRYFDNHLEFDSLKAAQDFMNKENAKAAVSK